MHHHCQSAGEEETNQEEEVRYSLAAAHLPGNYKVVVVSVVVVAAVSLVVNVRVLMSPI